jgi:hypothetical protein
VRSPVLNDTAVSWVRKVSSRFRTNQRRLGDDSESSAPTASVSTASWVPGAFSCSAHPLLVTTQVSPLRDAMFYVGQPPADVPELDECEMHLARRIRAVDGPVG